MVLYGDYGLTRLFLYWRADPNVWVGGKRTALQKMIKNGWNEVVEHAFECRGQPVIRKNFWNTLRIGELELEGWKRRLVDKGQLQSNLFRLVRKRVWQNCLENGWEVGALPLPGRVKESIQNTWSRVVCKASW